MIPQVRDTIPSALATLHSLLSDSNDALSELELRVSPALNPGAHPELPGPTDTGGSELRSSIESAIEKVRSLVYRINSLTSNLDL